LRTGIIVIKTATPSSAHSFHLKDANALGYFAGSSFYEQEWDYIKRSLWQEIRKTGALEGRESVGLFQGITPSKNSAAPYSDGWPCVHFGLPYNQGRVWIAVTIDREVAIGFVKSPDNKCQNFKYVGAIGTPNFAEKLGAALKNKKFAKACLEPSRGLIAPLKRFFGHRQLKIA